MARRGGRQRGNEVRGQMPPFRPGNNGGLGPTRFGFGKRGQASFPVKQRGADAVTRRGDSEAAPMRAEFDDVCLSFKIKEDVIMLDEHSWRGGIGGSQSAPFVQRFLFGRRGRANAQNAACRKHKTEESPELG